MATAGVESSMAPAPAPAKEFNLQGEFSQLNSLLETLIRQRESLKEQVTLLAEALSGGPLEKSRLKVASLNLQYYSSYPKDAGAAQTKLRRAFNMDEPARAPDVIAVQEGLAGVNVLGGVGFDLIVCSGERKVAQSVKDMVYSEPNTLKICPPEAHDAILCNQLYLRRGSDWIVECSGVEQTSSDMELNGGGDRCSGKLAVRSLVWAKLREKNSHPEAPAAFVICTHISGGRFEDQYFVQALSQERRMQVERCAEFYEKRRPNPRASDVGIVVGDFNAVDDYILGKGPMSGYFKSSIVNSEGVKADAAARNVTSDDELEKLFGEYMVSPFTALKRLGWHFAYGKEVGVTSGFGHLIDHMATSRPVTTEDAEVILLTNQKFGNNGQDTDLVITDHNAIQVTFAI